MKHSHVVLVAAAAFVGGLLPGCRPAQPTLAGGKPVEHWIQALQDPQRQVRKHALTKLGNVGAEEPAVLPALTGALKDREAEVRCAAIVALVKLPPAARTALSQLDAIKRHDPSPQVRAAATRAMESIHAKD